ncbi:hypothetical protein C806_03588 [Lachnospiraceae bacterium 3-1]|nr:hypothetical protein C806_03588 [Lachnospiraceae bacterium 3-1]
MNTNLNTDVYDADVYLRLSKEDGDKEESLTREVVNEWIEAIYMENRSLI